MLGFLRWLPLALVCTACTSIGHLDANVQGPDGDHAYFVIGVQPANMSVMLFRGSVSNGVFSQNPLATATFMGVPEDGFVMGETEAGNTLAITLATPRSGPNSISDEPLAACGGAKTIVFTAPAGKVVYVGSARYDRAGDGLIPNYGYDLDSARAFLKAHYPALDGKLEAEQNTLLPTGSICAN